MQLVTDCKNKTLLISKNYFMKIKFKDKIVGLLASIIGTGAVYTAIFIGACAGVPLYVIAPSLAFGAIGSFITYLIATE